jgi:tetratricopeptide (TPR) repeat protein
MPDSGVVAEWRIYLLRLLRRFDHAREAAGEARRKHPAAIGVLREAAWLEEAEGRLDVALEIVVTGLAADPNHRGLLGQQAQLLRDLGRFADAEQVSRGAANRRPHVPVGMIALAWTYEDQGRYDEAVAVIEKAAATWPEDATCARDLVDLLRLAHRFDEAEARCLEALQRRPDDRNLLHSYGLLLDATNRYDDAVRQFRRLLALDPYDRSAAVDASAALRSLRRFDEAERLIRPLVARFGHDHEPRAELGWVLRDQGRLAEAERVFDALRAEARSTDEKVSAACGSGWVRTAKGDHAGAERDFREALALRPLSTGARLGTAWALLRQDDPTRLAEAEVLCLDVLDHRGNNAEAHACLGVLNYRRGRLQLAEHHLRRSIEVDPFDGNYVDLGALYTKLGRFDEAADNLQTALKRDWFDAPPHVEMGILELHRAVDSDASRAAAAQAAAQHFRQALVLDPSSGAATIGLAVALSSGAEGGLPAAEAVLRQALDRPDCDEPTWRLRFMLARVLLQRGDEGQRAESYEEALDEARRAIEERPAEAEAHFVAGVAEYKLSEADPLTYTRALHRSRARRHLQRCREQDPSHQEAARILRFLRQDSRTGRRAAYGSAMLTAVSLGLLIAAWSAFLLSTRVTSAVIITLTPILAGLVALSLVLPLLIRIKLPGGVEADLSASLNQISSGPTGSLSVGPGKVTVGRIDVGSGPRGLLPRRGS